MRFWAGAQTYQNKQTNCLEFIFCPYATSSFGCIIAVLLLQYYCNYFSLQKLNQVLFSLMVLQVRTYLVKYVENRVGGKKGKYDAEGISFLFGASAMSGR